jgi:hypothetical protein
MSPRVQVMEKISRVAPLGLRFRDEATGLFVGGGLRVQTWPAGRPQLSRFATVNRSGVYVLQDLPGIRELEFGQGDAAWFETVPKKTFTVEVVDEEARFLPERFSAAIPFRGLFQLGCPTWSSFSFSWSFAAGSPSSMGTAVPLFSAATRSSPSPMAVLRAELFDPVAKAPAAWAFLEVATAGGAPARGLADEKGQAAVFFPYPEPLHLAGPADSGSFPSAGPPLTEQQWPISLRIFYAFGTPATPTPDLCAILSQPAAALKPDLTTGTLELDATLSYGRDLVLKTSGEPLSRLLVAPPPP